VWTLARAVQRNARRKRLARLLVEGVFTSSVWTVLQLSSANHFTLPSANHARAQSPIAAFRNLRSRTVAFVFPAIAASSVLVPQRLSLRRDLRHENESATLSRTNEAGLVTIRRAQRWRIYVASPPLSSAIVHPRKKNLHESSHSTVSQIT
jgi:DNA-binding transcriptional ArsR family regulator